MSTLAIITVHKGDDIDLFKTAESTRYHCIDQHIFVLSGATDSTIAKINSFPFLYPRKIVCIVNKDRSLYNAMNIGLDALSCDFAFFLNSGDELLLPANKLTKWLERFHTSSNYVFNIIQAYSGDYYLRSSSKTSRGEIFYPHPGFIFSHLAINRGPRFDETLPVSADQVWMREVARRTPTIEVAEPLTLFLLGGLSNKPNLKTVAMYFRKESIRSGINELIKFLLINILGSKLFYRLIAHLNGHQKIKQSTGSHYGHE